jgi:signal transduction histidine kinase
MAVVAVIAGSITVLIALVPGAHFAYRDKLLHVAIETTATLVGLLVAFLIAGRFGRSKRLDDLLLLTALTILAAANLAFGAVSATFGGSDPGAAPTWSAVFSHVIGVGVLAAAAFVPSRRIRRPLHAASIAVAGALALVALIGLGAELLGPRLPAGVDEPPTTVSSSQLSGHTVLLALQLVTMVGYGAAALGFARRAMRTGDELMMWLALGATLSVFARLNYFLYPSLYSSWVYVGDAFRLLFYLLLLAGAAREIIGYWDGVAAAAALEERRRIARDLHDGLAQELAFIKRRASTLADREPSSMSSQIAAAADRALFEARRAIAALSRPLDEQLHELLTPALEATAARLSVPISVSMEPGIVVAPAVQESLLRIATEAVSNAAHHSGAESISIELRRDPRVRLRISDDGAGFDPAAVKHTLAGGFGLVSMRERAVALGADLVIASAPGDGTTIEVVLP